MHCIFFTIIMNTLYLICRPCYCSTHDFTLISDITTVLFIRISDVQAMDQPAIPHKHISNKPDLERELVMVMIGYMLMVRFQKIK